MLQTERLALYISMIPIVTATKRSVSVPGFEPRPPYVPRKIRENVFRFAVSSQVSYLPYKEKYIFVKARLISCMY